MLNTVICAWGGVGKTQLCNNDENFTEVENSDYMWIYPDSIKETEFRKGSTSRIINSSFPQNYIYEIKAKLACNKIVFTGTRKEVIEALIEAKINIILVLPFLHDKAIYKSRFVERGNNQNWIEYYIAQWDESYKDLLSRGFLTIIMHSGSYLSDYKKNLKSLFL